MLIWALTVPGRRAGKEEGTVHVIGSFFFLQVFSFVVLPMIFQQ